MTGHPIDVVEVGVPGPRGPAGGGGSGSEIHDGAASVVALADNGFGQATVTAGGAAGVAVLVEDDGATVSSTTVSGLGAGGRVRLVSGAHELILGGTFPGVVVTSPRVKLTDESNFVEVSGSGVECGAEGGEILLGGNNLQSLIRVDDITDGKVTIDAANGDATIVLKDAGNVLRITTATDDINIASGGALQLNGDTIGLFGVTPVAQSAAIPDASGGANVDTESRAAINTLLAYLRSRGDIAT